MARRSLVESAVSGVERNAFSLFEPFDCAPRDQWVLDMAESDGVKLSAEGERFQTGLLLCDDAKTITNAGSQDGKTIAHAIDVVCALTGNVPICMQYDAGVDTGIPREDTKENRQRFGDPVGNIVGIGRYPREKLAPRSEQIWICCFKQNREVSWIPLLRKLIPEHLLDTSQGNNGYREDDNCFVFRDGGMIYLVSYEQDYRRVESRMAHMIVLDEEPPDRRFFVAALEHCRFLRICFTPYNGVTWIYDDVVKPIEEGRGDFTQFHCTQFDSPYHDAKAVAKKRNTYKAWELKARVYGMFADVEGKPYYPYELTRKFIQQYVPSHTMATIYPRQPVSTVREALGADMQLVAATSPAADVWEIWEPRKEGDIYWLAADASRGDNDPEMVCDRSAAYVRRLPHDGESSPPVVAALHSTDRNVEFAWLCLYAAVYYNFALLCPECKGEDGAVFVAETRDYPFYYRQSVLIDKLRKTREVLGFQTEGKTRQMVFEAIGTYVRQHSERCPVAHYPWLVELNQLIVGKKGRPDHTNRGSSDCLMAFGISEYVYQYDRSQIRDNYPAGKAYRKAPEVRLDPRVQKRETRPVLGSFIGLDARSRMIEYRRSQRWQQTRATR